MATYIGIVHKDDDSDFGVSFPDFPGCVSAAATLDELAAAAEEALGLHVQGMMDECLPIPPPSELEELLDDPDNRGGLAILVPLRIPTKIVRVNITVPEDALRDIDAYAEAHGYTRSGFLVSAARRAMTEAGK
jgi:predicted RNase H-like HicB family nuclease